MSHHEKQEVCDVYYKEESYGESSEKMSTRQVIDEYSKITDEFMFLDIIIIVIRIRNGL